MSSCQDLIYSGKGLQRFPTIKTNGSINKFDLSNNNIINFYGFKPCHDIKQLILDNNPQLSTFIGLTAKHNPIFNCDFSNDDQSIINEGIANLSLIKTPLGEYPHIKLMAVIVFGDTLTMVNGNQIPMSTYRLANKIRDETLEYLLNGWVITSTKPLRILNVQTRARKILYPQETNENSFTENDSVENVQNDEAKSVEVMSVTDDGQSQHQNEGQEEEENTENQDPADQELQNKFNVIKQKYMDEIEKKSNSPHHSPNNSRTLTKTTSQKSPKKKSLRSVLRDKTTREIGVPARKAPFEQRIKDKNSNNQNNTSLKNENNQNDNIDENSIQQNEESQNEEIGLNPELLNEEDINEPASESEGMPDL